MAEMNRGQDFESDTDESDEDFRPDALAGESAASEDESEDCDVNDFDENQDVLEKKCVRRKNKRKHINEKDTKSIHESDDNINTSRRATRQTDKAQTKKKGKDLERDELLSDEEDKSRTNALWADFLKDVDPAATSAGNNSSKLENKSSSSSDKEGGEKLNEAHSKICIKKQSEEKKIVVNEVPDFAVVDTIIESELYASSIKENKATSLQLPKKQPFSRIIPGVGIKRQVTGSPAGLGSILNQLGKKKKISVLEKSQMDWKNFKQSEGIDEQLQTFNKGKNGYLERQDFLQRTDLRQFEIEKNLRQNTRRNY